MCNRNEETKPGPAEFDFSAFPDNTLFHERRSGRDRRWSQGAESDESGHEKTRPAPDHRRAKKERRRRIDPTTFEKQYTPDELEFMNAMQRFKEASGRSFPTHGEVLKVAIALGYRLVAEDPLFEAQDEADEPETLFDPQGTGEPSDSTDDQIAVSTANR
jgi:hypothetical protein